MDDRLFSYSNISKVCNNILKDNDLIYIEDITNGCKILAALFIIVNVISIYLGNKKNTDNNSDLKKIPITIPYLLKQLGFLLLVFNFSSLTMYMDSLLSAFCTSIEQNINDDSESLYNVVNTGLISSISKEELEGGDYNALQSIHMVINNLFNPLYWVTTLSQWIGWFINTFLLGFMLMERAATLIILNIFAPFIIALSVLESFRDRFIQWIKIYCATFLISPVLLIVGTLCSLFYRELASSSTLFGLVTGDMMIVILMVVLVKARLYKSGISILNKLFGV